MTHVLRSGLVMGYTASYFPLIVLGYHLDSNRSYGPLPDTLCPGACIFPPQGSRGHFGPTGLHGLCFGFCFAGPLPLRSLTNGPLFRVRFGESLVVRLYSEIDHLHFSIEAQCVSHLLPLGDCHSCFATVLSWHFFPISIHHSGPIKNYGRGLVHPWQQENQ